MAAYTDSLQKKALDENLRQSYLEHEKAAEKDVNEPTVPATPTAPGTKGPRILAALHESPLSVSRGDLDQLDGLPRRDSTDSLGSSCNTMHTAPTMTEAQVARADEIFAQNRREQKARDDARRAKETPARQEFIRSVLRERNNDVSMQPNLWGVPIGTVFPCPEWEVPYEDEEYKRKLAIARTLPYTHPELYLPGHNVSTIGPVMPITPDSSHTNDGLSPNDGKHGHIDSDGAFHPVPTLPTPERIRELEERKRNERGELLSPSINRVRKEPGAYGSPDSNADNSSPRSQPESFLRSKASTPYLTSEEHLEPADVTVNTGPRQGISTARIDRSLTTDNNTTEKGPNAAVSGEQIRKRPSLFNMKKPMLTKKEYGPVKGSKITPEKDIAKQKSTFYNLKQSLSSTKMSEPLLQSGTSCDTEQIKKESSLSSLKHSFSFTKAKEPAASFETTPERAETEKKGGFKNFIKSFSPRKGSGTAFQTHQAGLRKVNYSKAMHVLEDGLPADADRVKSSITETIFITVAKPTKTGGLLGHMRKLRNINADDQFANHICGDTESDEDVDDIMITLVKAGFTDTKSSKKQKSPRAVKEGKYPSLPAGAGTGVLPDGSLATAYAGMGLQGLHGRSNSTARDLEARKMAEVKSVDAKRSEDDRYVSCCNARACWGTYQC